MGDASNAELGIALTDALAAEARLEGRDALETQREWGSRYLGERILGMAVFGALIVTPMVYMSASRELGVIWTGVLVLGGYALLAAPGERGRRLDKIRARQLATFRAQKSERMTEGDTEC